MRWVEGTKSAHQRSYIGALADSSKAPNVHHASLNVSRGITPRTTHY